MWREQHEVSTDIYLYSFFSFFAESEGFVSAMISAYRSRLSRDKNPRPWFEKALPFQKEKERSLWRSTLFFFLAESEGFEPPVHAMCTPHFECGSFDHSDNFPLNAAAKVLLFFEICNFRYIFFVGMPHFIILLG